MHLKELYFFFVWSSDEINWMNGKNFALKTQESIIKATQISLKLKANENTIFQLLFDLLSKSRIQPFIQSHSLTFLSSFSLSTKKPQVRNFQFNYFPSPLVVCPTDVQEIENCFFLSLSLFLSILRNNEPSRLCLRSGIEFGVLLFAIIYSFNKTRNILEDAVASFYLSISRYDLWSNKFSIAFVGLYCCAMSLVMWKCEALQWNILIKTCSDKTLKLLNTKVL